MSPQERWQTLIAVARQAPAQRAALSDFHAASLAAHGMKVYQQQQEAERAWRGMAIAASLFLTCMLGLGTIASLFIDDEIFAAHQSFAQVTRTVPSTSFIPAPPRPPPIAATVATHMALSPSSLVDSLHAWISPPATTSETLP